MAKYDLNIGTSVHCTDGDCGKLFKVVIDPHTQRVTDLIVKRGFLLTTDRVLPAGTVERATGEQIYLSVSSQDLAAYPEYREIEFQELAPAAKDGLYDEGDVRYWRQGYRMVCEAPVVPMVRSQVHKGVRADGAVIEQGTPVLNAQGTVGYVDHLLIDAKKASVTHIVVRKGILPYYPVVPISAVTMVSDEAVSISLTKEQIKEMPRYKRRNAEDIEAEARDRMAGLGFDQQKIDVVVQGSIVRLIGHVQNIAAKRHAEAIVRAVEGVVEVENALETEMSILTRVRYALLSDPRTDLAAIDVVNEHGVITLKGNVDDAQIREAAEAIAAEQPGVISVVNALKVEPDEDTGPLQAHLLAWSKILDNDH
jgi:osmotically-inducible protein OsmY